MRQSVVQVDAFTNQPFSGNPAAVCVMESPCEEACMQAIAAEMNLSETAFVWPEGGRYRLRWFTPTDEVDLCGHATLATAHVLWTEGHLSTDAVALFQTKGGPLQAKRAEGGWITLDFPLETAIALTPTEEGAGDTIRAMSDAFGGAQFKWVGRNRMDYLVEVNSDAEVMALEPDMVRLKRIDTRGFIVTAKSSEPGVDFVSRFFCPRIGVDEDPVCGSAHCALGPYWMEELCKTELVAKQVSKRGGALRVAVRPKRVEIAGQAVTVMKGEIILS